MRKKEVFTGVATALITPFLNGEIDYPSLAMLIDRQIDAGVGTLVIGGTTAEAAVLSDDERYALYSFTRGYIGGRAKIIFGTGTNDTRVAIAHTKFAQELGCDGVLLVTPYYNKGTELGIEKHYLNIAECTDLPIILYNVPSRTGVNMGINLLERLADHPNIVGIKEASDSIDRLVLLAAFGDNLHLYSGNDSQIYPTLALGGRGVISVMSNIIPKTADQLCKDYFDGKHKEALDLQIKLLPFIRTLFLETNPSPIKYAMSTLGLCSPEVRLPLAEPRESTKEAILHSLNLLADLRQ
ncbi:MAG: 4-hydroxy-tetrahydrodipicolinate synthase [Clostridia bacterium]|nr:4-hydroxy-tetrahydrodipicolinate synthase [Clostridia bacterium]